MPNDRSVRKIQTSLLGLAFIAIAAGPPVEAQVHETRAGLNVLRANVVRADTLPAETLKRHGIEVGPNRAVLNVVVLEQGPGGPKGVRASVEAKAEVLAGYDLDINMKPIVEDGGASYLGGFAIPSQASAIRFSIAAQPVEGERLTLQFTEHLPARR
jgi:hypothetical protein